MTVDDLIREYRAHESHGGWRMALLVACGVEPGTGEGRPWVTVSRETVTGKVSAREFARRAGGGAATVLRYLRAWEAAAADDGLVPHAATLTPDDLERVKLPPADEWAGYLRKAGEPGDRTPPPPRARASGPSDTGSPHARPSGAAARSRRQTSPLAGKKPRQADDPRVVEWVRRALLRGLDREEMRASSAAGEDDWPLPEGLTGNAHQAALAVLANLERMGISSPVEGGEWVTEPRRRDAAARRQQRELAARRKAGEWTALAEFTRRVYDVAGVLQSWDVRNLDLAAAAAADDDGFLAEDLRRAFDALTSLAEWTDDALAGFVAAMGTAAVDRKIAALRATNGRTPAEQATALRLAARLERARDRRGIGG